MLRPGNREEDKMQNTSADQKEAALEQWHPNIIAFTCNYCAYAAADLAGVMRLQYSSTIRIIRLPCTGKLDPAYILRALEKGIDGVFGAGCMEGQCHYLEGNINAQRHVNTLKKQLAEVDISSDRLNFYHLSAAQCQRWVEICNAFVKTIEKIGPSPVWLAEHGFLEEKELNSYWRKLQMVGNHNPGAF